MACSREKVLGALAEIAPLHLSESWDNTGLLVDPDGRRQFVRAFLTIDLTESTLDEADELAADLIVSYHPPIFKGLRRLRRGLPGEGLIVRALRAGQTIYSPHTALDSAIGGMTEWLARPFGNGQMEVVVPHPTEPGAGAGRLVYLDEPLSLEDAVIRLKAHLDLKQVRISRGVAVPRGAAVPSGIAVPSGAAVPSGTADSIRSVAVCPGAGGSVFEQVGRVDLLVTGEMRHHDVLSRAAQGTSVILTDHTNTERGYLLHLGRRLKEACSGLEVSVSKVDRDPLEIV